MMCEGKVIYEFDPFPREKPCPNTGATEHRCWDGTVRTLCPLHVELDVRNATTSATTAKAKHER